MRQLEYQGEITRDWRASYDYRESRKFGIEIVENDELDNSM